jgi:hypothetical protein
MVAELTPPAHCCATLINSTGDMRKDCNTPAHVHDYISGNKLMSEYQETRNINIFFLFL